MMYCHECDTHIDTDFDLDGLWAGHDYVCENCCGKNTVEQLATLKDKYEAKEGGK